MFESVTVEPVEFLYCLMFTVSSVVRDNLFIEKVCRISLNISENICSDLSYYKNISENVHQIVTDLQMLDGILVAIPSVIFSLFLGSWSDKNGRRLLLLFPFVGNILSFLAYIFNYYFFYELNPYFLLLGSCTGLFGGYVTLNIGLYGYVSDVTTHENRTRRLSILNGVFSLGYVIGNLTGGHLYTAIGNYYIIFSISILFGFLGIAYSLFLIKESIRNISQESGNFFDLKNVIESLKTVTRFREDKPNARTHLLLLIFNFVVFMFCLNTFHYDYLLMRNRFEWDTGTYSNFLIVTRVCRFIGLFLLLPICSRFVSDDLISSIGVALTLASYFLLALGSESWMMFLAVPFQFNSIITVIIRSQVTKTVNSDEIGKVFSVIGCAQALVPLLSNPIFGLLYKETLASLPGAYLLFICGLLIIVLGTTCYLAIQKQNTES